MTNLPLAFGNPERVFDNTLRHLLIEAINDNRSFADRFDAEVWLVDMINRLKAKKLSLSASEQISLLKLIHQEASKANLAPELVIAVIDVESNFNRWAISSAGAQGLMQVMPFWLKEIGKKDDNLFRIKTNLRLGCTILKYYLDKEKGNLSRALARYNGSLGSTRYSDRVLKRLQNRWYRQ